MVLVVANAKALNVLCKAAGTAPPRCRMCFLGGENEITHEGCN